MPARSNRINAALTSYGQRSASNEIVPVCPQYYQPTQPARRLGQPSSPSICAAALLYEQVDRPD